MSNSQQNIEAKQSLATAMRTHRKNEQLTIAEVAARIQVSAFTIEQLENAAADESQETLDVAHKCILWYHRNTIQEANRVKLPRKKSK